MQVRVTLEDGDRVIVRSRNGFLAHMDGMEGVIDQASADGTIGVRFDDGSWHWFHEPLNMNLSVLTDGANPETIIDGATIKVEA